MNNYKKILYVTAAVLAVCAILSAFPSGAGARDPVPGFVTEYDFKVGGEPGEDPHLKTLPETQIMMESDGFVSSIDEAALDEDIYGIQVARTREGRGHFRGSRVNLVWRMLFHSWLWTVHR